MKRCGKPSPYECHDCMTSGITCTFAISLCSYYGVINQPRLYASIVYSSPDLHKLLI